MRLLGLLDDLQGPLIDAHIHHIETIGLEHGGYDILTDTVQIAFDRGDDNRAHGGHIPLLSLDLGIQYLHGRFERLSGHDEFGKICLATLELLPDDVRPF